MRNLPRPWRSALLRCCAFGLALACVATPRTAQADDPAVPPPPHRLQWKRTWRRTGWTDVGVTAGLFTGALVLNTVVGPDEEPHWTGPILFDNWMRNHLVGATLADRDSAGTLSDWMFLGSMGHAILFDPLVVTWAADRNPDVALQMLAIDAQAYSVSFFVNTLTKRLVSRERPYGQECGSDPNYDPGCSGKERYRSYYSGHAALTATSAGLICAHHHHMPLYGNQTLDGLACATAVALTATTGALRIVSDNHWATDVVSGHLLGYAAGYWMPSLLYYREIRLLPPSSGTQIHMAVLPTVSPEQAGLQAVGWF